MSKRVYTKEFIRGALHEGANGRQWQTWCRRAVLAIHAKQTHDEQMIGETRHHNKVGFSAAHAHVGTIIAQKILANRPLEGRDYGWLRKHMPKYARQLAEIANARDA